MFDDQPVHRTMERIFTPVATTGPAEPLPPRPRTIKAPARRRWFMGKDGIAAAGFALAVTALGVVMVPLLSTPTAPPAPRAAMPTTTPPAPPIAAPAPVLAPAPVTAPAPMPAQPAPIVAAATPAPPVAATPRRIAKATRARGQIIRRHRARPRVARHYRRQEAPRLYGAALRRALARDVVLTRRLNQQALRRLRER
jgi:hypothetical protein